MQITEMYPTYKGYKTWEKFLGKNAKEKTLRDTFGGRKEYYKELHVTVGKDRLVVVGPVREEA